MISALAWAIVGSVAMSPRTWPVWLFGFFSCGRGTGPRSSPCLLIGRLPRLTRMGLRLVARGLL
jgi:hypothetical protein